MTTTDGFDEFLDSDDEKPLIAHTSEKSAYKIEDDDSLIKSCFSSQKNLDSQSHDNPLSIFETFFTDEIIQKIVKSTNISIQKTNTKYKKSVNNTNPDEIKALLGVLILTAAMSDNHFKPEEIFNSEIRGTQYVSCMSHLRFSFLVQNLRFDEKVIETKENEYDPFSPMKNIWGLLIKQCHINYIPGNNVTIDEILVPFRGKCSFKVFRPDNEKKYGIKIMTMCDSSSYYMIDAIPYLGKYTNTQGSSLAESYVKELTKTIHGTKTNVTIKNIKPSIYLAEQLLEEPYNLTLLGSLKATSKEIPKKLKRNINRKVGTSIFSSCGAVTFLSYNLSATKMLFLLSSADKKDAIATSTQVPSMLESYNATKDSVLAFNRMCSDMTCKRKTNSWTISLFYNLINMITVNCYILYCQHCIKNNSKPMQRRVFMNKLHSDLANPWRKIRLNTIQMPQSVKDNIRAVLNKQNISYPSIAIENKEIPEGKRKTCSMCHYKKRRNTRKVCKKCHKHICGEHTSSICVICAQEIITI